MLNIDNYTIEQQKEILSFLQSLEIETVIVGHGKIFTEQKSYYVKDKIFELSNKLILNIRKNSKNDK